MLGAGLDLAPSASRSVRGAAAPVPSLDLNFLYGVLPAGVTFTRASTAGYTDVTGGAQTAAINQPRLEAGGLRIEDATGAGAAETATVSDVSWFNATTGTIWVEFSLLTVAGGQAALSIDDATSNERIMVRASAGALNAIVSDGGALQASLALGALTAGPIYRVALAYAAGDFAACLNGGTVGTDATGTLPTVTRMTLGSRVAAEHLNGHVRRVRVYRSRLSNATLQALTV